MIPWLTSCFSDFSQLFFPHNCEGCGTDILRKNDLLCATCRQKLPLTGFFTLPGNPVEKSFYGRLPIEQAGAACYFTKDSLLQHLFIELKYRKNREAGYFLGRLMGYALAEAGRFSAIEALVPLPLNNRKEYQRGYNQAALLCEGIYQVWQKPVLAHAIARIRFTETQTRRNRLNRWQNMQGVFEVTSSTALENKHILLIDDVITTGATLEACGTELLKVKGVKLSLAAAGYTI
ncbi:MAG: ComF family protein [Sediminibacterium sp.]